MEKEHHKRHEPCTNRPTYRQGRDLTSVKVYTVAQESCYLLVQGVPTISAQTELSKLFAMHGIVKQVKKLLDYPAEQFTEVYLIKYEKVHKASLAKHHLDDTSFYGGVLHICYAPEYETIAETRQKLINRRKTVAYRIKKLELESAEIEAIKDEPKEFVAGSSDDDSNRIIPLSNNEQQDDISERLTPDGSSSTYNSEVNETLNAPESIQNPYHCPPRNEQNRIPLLGGNIHSQPLPGPNHLPPAFPSTQPPPHTRAPLWRHEFPPSRPPWIPPHPPPGHPHNLSGHRFQPPPHFPIDQHSRNVDGALNSRRFPRPPSNLPCSEPVAPPWMNHDRKLLQNSSEKKIVEDSLRECQKQNEVNAETAKTVPVIKQFVPKVKGRFIPRQVVQGLSDKAKQKLHSELGVVNQPRIDVVNDNLRKNALTLKEKVTGPELPTEVELKRKTFKSSSTGKKELDKSVLDIRKRVLQFSEVAVPRQVKRKK